MNEKVELILRARALKKMTIRRNNRYSVIKRHCIKKLND